MLQFVAILIAIVIITVAMVLRARAKAEQKEILYHYMQQHTAPYPHVYIDYKDMPLINER